MHLNNVFQESGIFLSKYPAQTERYSAFGRFMRDVFYNLFLFPASEKKTGSSEFIDIIENLFLFFLDCAVIMDNDIVRGCEKGTRKNEEKNGRSRAGEEGDCRRRRVKRLPG